MAPSVVPPGTPPHPQSPGSRRLRDAYDASMKPLWQLGAAAWQEDALEFPLQ
jgi:hypothetical protein